jgi:hypothetical protein
LRALYKWLRRGVRGNIALQRSRRQLRRAVKAEIKTHPMPEPAQATVRLLVAPANFAGQGHLWARAAERHVAGVAAHSFALLNGRLDFTVDYSATRRAYANPSWQQSQLEHVLGSYSHVLIEAERPVFGGRYGPECSKEIPVLREAGIKVALIAHGSDVRVPSLHAERYEWSPFRDSDWDIIWTLEYNATRNAAFLNGFDGPVLASTPDLLDDVPKALWCPVIVDPARWANDELPLQRARPIVAHAPSNARMKGSELIDPVIQELADEGLIEYRRITGVAPAEMPSVYRTADIVLDQFRIGSYGVAACEGMAASRVVVGHIADNVRDRVLAASGLDLPIVEATPDNLGNVLRDLVEDRERAQDIASSSAAFVNAVHDGRLSADALTPFLAEVTR